MSCKALLEMVCDMSANNILRTHVFMKLIATSRLHTARLIFYNQLCIVEVSTICKTLVNQYKQVTTYGFRNTKMLGVTQVNPFPEFQPLKKPITRAFATEPSCSTKAESVVMTRNKSQQPDLLAFYGRFPLVSLEQICYLQHAEVPCSFRISWICRALVRCNAYPCCDRKSLLASISALCSTRNELFFPTSTVR